jgi:glycosyl transferase, family 25
MHCFVISLPGEADRRASICGQMKRLGMDFEFIDAIRGKDLYGDGAFYDRGKALRIELRDMTAGEVGCALSHQKAYQLIADRSLPHAFVMEDDAILSDDVPAVLRLLETRIRPNEIITLERCDVYSRAGIESLYGDFRLVRPRMIKYGSMSQAAGYIIGKDAARKIRSINKPVFVPADSWGQYVGQIEFRGVIPTLTLVRQDISFECRTQDYQRTAFTRRKPISMLLYAFRTRSWAGRHLVKLAKRIVRKSSR